MVLMQALAPSWTARSGVSVTIAPSERRVKSVAVPLGL